MGLSDAEVAENDRVIKERFAGDLEDVVRGARDAWREDPRSRLAMIILIDQMSRHIYRDLPAAFDADPMAQKLTLEGLERGMTSSLRHIERFFFCMPLCHAEDRDLQRRAVEIHEELLATCPEEERPVFADFLMHAKRLQSTIERFGRFPHRNALLGRSSTPEELAYLG